MRLNFKESLADFIQHATENARGYRMAGETPDALCARITRLEDELAEFDPERHALMVLRDVRTHLAFLCLEWLTLARPELKNEFVALRRKMAGISQRLAESIYAFDEAAFSVREEYDAALRLGLKPPDDVSR